MIRKADIVAMQGLNSHSLADWAYTAGKRTNHDKSVCSGKMMYLMSFKDVLPSVESLQQCPL